MIRASDNQTPPAHKAHKGDLALVTKYDGTRHLRCKDGALNIVYCFAEVIRTDRLGNVKRADWRWYRADSAVMVGSAAMLAAKRGKTVKQVLEALSEPYDTLEDARAALHAFLSAEEEEPA